MRIQHSSRESFTVELSVVENESNVGETLYADCNDASVSVIDVRSASESDWAIY